MVKRWQVVCHAKSIWLILFGRAEQTMILITLENLGRRKWVEVDKNLGLQCFNEILIQMH